MANTIQALIDEEVTVAHMAEVSKTNQGVLRAVDDHGILLSAEDPKDGPTRVFLPWSSIQFVRAVGKYEPPKQNRRATRIVR